jgi:hypothetical protein
MWPFFNLLTSLSLSGMQGRTNHRGPRLGQGTRARARVAGCSPGYQPPRQGARGYRGQGAGSHGQGLPRPGTLRSVVPRWLRAALAALAAPPGRASALEGAARHGRRPTENGGKGSRDIWDCWPRSVSAPRAEQGRGRGREALRARVAGGHRRPAAAGTQGRGERGPWPGEVEGGESGRAEGSSPRRGNNSYSPWMNLQLAMDHRRLVRVVGGWGTSVGLRAGASSDYAEFTHPKAARPREQREDAGDGREGEDSPRTAMCRDICFCAIWTWGGR